VEVVVVVMMMMMMMMMMTMMMMMMMMLLMMMMMTMTMMMMMMMMMMMILVPAAWLFQIWTHSLAGATPWPSLHNGWQQQRNHYHQHRHYFHRHHIAIITTTTTNLRSHRYQLLHLLVPSLPSTPRTSLLLLLLQQQHPHAEQQAEFQPSAHDTPTHTRITPPTTLSPSPASSHLQPPALQQQPPLRAPPKQRRWTPAAAARTCSKHVRLTRISGSNFRGQHTHIRSMLASTETSIRLNVSRDFAAVAASGSVTHALTWSWWFNAGNRCVI